MRIRSLVTLSVTAPCTGMPQVDSTFGSVDRLGLLGARQVLPCGLASRNLVAFGSFPGLTSQAPRGSENPTKPGVSALASSVVAPTLIPNTKNGLLGVCPSGMVT